MNPILRKLTQDILANMTDEQLSLVIVAVDEMSADNKQKAYETVGKLEEIIERRKQKVKLCNEN